MTLTPTTLGRAWGESTWIHWRDVRCPSLSHERVAALIDRARADAPFQRRIERARERYPDLLGDEPDTNFDPGEGDLVD